MDNKILLLIFGCIAIILISIAALLIAIKLYRYKYYEEYNEKIKGRMKDMKHPTYIERIENNKKTFKHRLEHHKLDEYMNSRFVIEQLKSLFEDRLDFIEDEEDVFEKDAFAVYYAIEFISKFAYNEMALERKNEDYFNESK